jgi:peptidoglycan/LPS O-acetylase OafA/YrhL
MATPTIDVLPGASASRKAGVDVMRAVAVSSVLGCHTMAFLVKSDGQWPPLARAVRDVLAYLGVEIFFVLSGFLIGNILLREFDRGVTLRGLGNFWSRRWLRTFPAYYGWLALHVVVAIALGRAVPALLAYVTFVQGALDSPTFFPESWSICSEEWFYLCFPLLLSVLSMVNVRGRRATLVAVALVLSIGLAVRFRLASTRHVDFARVILHATATRLDACSYGVLGALVQQRFPAYWHRAKGLWRLGLAVAALQLAMFGVLGLARMTSSVVIGTTFVSVTGASIACFLPAAWGASSEATTRTRRMVTYVSLCSYSLYLCQLPLRDLLQAATPSRWLGTPGVAPVLMIVHASASLLVAGASYKCLEAPFLRLRGTNPRLPRDLSRAPFERPLLGNGATRGDDSSERETAETPR